MSKWYLSQKPSIRDNIILTIMCLGIFGLFLGVFALAERPRLDTDKLTRATYYVHSSDTLWGLASDYCPDGVDYREWIAAVSEVNGLTGGQIYAGQKIVIFME